MAAKLVKQNESFTAPVDGYFVPEARMKQILDALNEKEFQLSTQKK